MPTLAEIRAKLLAEDNNNTTSSGGREAVYPFWNMDVDATAVIRFLPDANPENTFFWQERQVIKMPFVGVKGKDESKPIMVQVPCIEMWDGNTCPVHAEIRPWFKDPSMEDLARKYWKKKSYIFQGFVVTDPMNEQDKPENSIRRFVIGPQIFKVLKGALLDPDMEHMPTDYDNGTDFRLTKTQNGQYADYGTSNWARKERGLNEEERGAIEQFGLSDLGEFLPKKPSDADLKVIMEMFEASVDGELYDLERWGNTYRPWGMDAPTGNGGSSNDEKPAAESKPENASTSAPAAAADDDIPFKSNEEAAAAAGNSEDNPAGQNAADILNMIRNRKS